MYCSEEINLLTKKAKQRLLGEHTYKNFCNILERIYKKYKIVCMYRRDSKVQDHDILIGGLYDGDTATIILDVIFSTNTKTVIVTEEEWDNVAFLLTQTLQHEMIHAYQCSIRSETHFFTREKHEAATGYIGEEREYLSNFDEIHAYAHCIALELRRKYTQSTIDRYLRSPSSIRGCPTWNAYKKMFRDSDWEQLRRRLLKHTVRWLSTAEPYKENK